MIDPTNTTWLEVTDASGATRILPFTNVDLLLGRERTCDLVIDDEQASRQHARLDRRNEGPVVLTDLGSTNGTRLNGRRIESVMTLKVGDDIQIGGHHIRIVAEKDLDPGTIVEVPEPGTRVEAQPAPPPRRG